MRVELADSTRYDLRPPVAVYASKLREELSEMGVTSGEDVAYLAQVLSFLLLSTPAEDLSVSLRRQTNRYSWRKMKTSVDLIAKMFSLFDS